MSARATCTGMKLGSADAARTILHAVRCDLLPLLVQRLSPEERLAISAGDIFVWEEKSLGSDSGIERWTDSKRWSASRVKDAFLLYNEKLEPNESFVAVGSELKIVPQRDCLVKQTFTSHVTTARGRRKWHLIAYYTESSLSTLRTTDDFPLLRDLDVPHDKYPSARAVKGRPENIFNPPRNASNRPITPQYHFYALPPPPSQPSQPSNVSRGHRPRGGERAGPYHSPATDSRVQSTMISKARRERALTSVSDMSAESADSGYQSASQSDAAAGRSRSSSLNVAAYANHVPLPDADHAVFKTAARDDDGYLAPEIHAPTAIKHHSGWFGREMEYAAEQTPSTSLQARVRQGSSLFLAPSSPSNFGYRHHQAPRHLDHQPHPQEQPTHPHHSTTHKTTYPKFESHSDHKNPVPILPPLPRSIEQDYYSKNRNQHGPPRLLPPLPSPPRGSQQRWPILPDPRRMGPPTPFVSRALTDQHMLNGIPP